MHFISLLCVGISSFYIFLLVFIAQMGCNKDEFCRDALLGERCCYLPLNSDPAGTDSGRCCSGPLPSWTSFLGIGSRIIPERRMVVMMWIFVVRTISIFLIIN